MYIHKSVQYKLIIDLARQYSNFESVFIEISNRGKNKLIGNLYRPPPPPPGKLVDGFIEDITSLFSDDCMNKYECYIMGDFTLDMLKMSQNTKN